MAGHDTIPDFAILEIVLRWRHNESFDVSLRYSEPNSNGETSTFVEQPLELDADRLAILAPSEPAYGRVLSDGLLGHAGVREAFAEARSAAERKAVALRLLLCIDSAAPARFHALRWETLRDPHDDHPIATTKDVVFSRWVSNSSWRPIAARSDGNLSALVVISSPSDLDHYASGDQPLTKIDIDAELQSARTALGSYPMTELRSPGASLESITAELDRGRHDVLYVMCHGTLVRNDSVLFLEGRDGNVAPTAGIELVERLGALVKKPILVVLGVPMTSEGASQADGAMRPLGLRLAEIGVSAVLAMQGRVSLRTVTILMPVFFRELLHDGQVDRAMAVARGAVRNRPDWWSPVLYTRLRSGRIGHSAASETLSDENFRTSSVISTGKTMPEPTTAQYDLIAHPDQVGSSSSPLRAFLCHSSSDKEAVRQLYRRLRADGIWPWLDEEDILPGQVWAQEIRKAIRSCDVVLVCLSRSSIGKVGYIQKEIKDVLDVADEQPEGTIFMIPVRLEPCEVPDRIGRLQWVDLFEGDTGYERLVRSLRRVTAKWTN